MYGGVIANTGELTITGSAFSNNQSESRDGGVIWNWANGEMTITGSTFSNNQSEGDGGVIYNHITSTLSVSNSAFSGNQSERAGGAIYNGDGAILIETSTIDNNTAKTRGAGIANSGQLSITNSTISGNTLMREWEPYPGIVPDYGSAIAHDSSEPLTIRFTTISNNSGISPIQAVSVHGPAVITNSIVADNPGGDCGIFYGGTINASEANLDSDSTCDGFTLSADPRLDPLDDNGGPTQTHALKPNSAAIDAATGTCPATDQRGEPRPYPTGGECDIGAYEYSPGGGPPPPAPMLGTQTPTPTPPPAPMLPAQTPTPTPTQSLSWIGTVDIDTPCYYGPNPLFEVVSSLKANTPVSLIGISEKKTYVIVDNPMYPGVHCWSNINHLTLPDNVKDLLETIPDPPLPTLTPTVYIAPTATFTPPPATGSISGLVFQDNNSNGSRQGGEAGMSGVTVVLGQGACASSGYQSKVSSGNGSFSFTNLPAGTYCLSVDIPMVCDTYSAPTTQTQYTINLSPGGSVSKLFGYATFPC